MSKRNTTNFSFVMENIHLMKIIALYFATRLKKCKLFNGSLHCIQWITQDEFMLDAEDDFTKD